MASAHPYDIPPRPDYGDSDPNITYAAVGRALSAWEAVEHALAVMFISLIGASTPDQLGAINRIYGSVLTYRGRCDMLMAAKDAFFASYDDADLNTAIKKHLDLCSNYSPRRNEIAHGIVQPFIGAIQAQQTDKLTWILMPSSYSTNKREIVKMPAQLSKQLRDRGVLFQPFEARPKYLYSSAEIDAFTGKFSTLEGPTAMLTRRILKARIVARTPASPGKPA